MLAIASIQSTSFFAQFNVRSRTAHGTQHTAIFTCCRLPQHSACARAHPALLGARTKT